MPELLISLMPSLTECLPHVPVRNNADQVNSTFNDSDDGRFGLWVWMKLGTILKLPFDSGLPWL